MRSFCTLAFLALPLFSVVFAEEAAAAASPTKTGDADSVYATAQDAFQDLLNALPEESLQAALSSLKDFKDGVFESHHRGVEHVHDNNPALATKLIVAAVRDLKKRQVVSVNGTTPNPPPQSSTQLPPPAESSAAPPSSSAERPVVVPVEATTTDDQGRTTVQTTSVLSQVTASVEVTVVRTNSQGNPETTTENRPAVVKTTTDSEGRTTVTTSAADFAPTAGEVRTTTDAKGSTLLTTYTPGGGKISSVKLITTTGADGRPSTLTSYTFVDPAQPTETDDDKPGQTDKPGLQNGASAGKNYAVGYAMVGGALALLI